jgi:hypothetical protein
MGVTQENKGRKLVTECFHSCFTIKQVFQKGAAKQGDQRLTYAKREARGRRRNSLRAIPKVLEPTLSKTLIPSGYGHKINQ